MNLNLLEPISKTLTATIGLFKDTSGKLSSKRTISGLIIMTAMNDVAVNGITFTNLILTTLGILPVLVSIFEQGNEKKG